MILNIFFEDLEIGKTNRTFWKKATFIDRENILKLEAEGQEIAKNLRSLEQFVNTVKDQNNFLVTEYFFTCSWRFLTSNKLEKLEFK